MIVTHAQCMKPEIMARRNVLVILGIRQQTSFTNSIIQITLVKQYIHLLGFVLAFNSTKTMKDFVIIIMLLTFTTDK